LWCWAWLCKLQVQCVATFHSPWLQYVTQIHLNRCHVVDRVQCLCCRVVDCWILANRNSELPNKLPIIECSQVKAACLRHLHHDPPRPRLLGPALLARLRRSPPFTELKMFMTTTGHMEPTALKMVRFSCAARAVCSI
jgi:hypothetical protein